MATAAAVGGASHASSPAVQPLGKPAQFSREKRRLPRLLSLGWTAPPPFLPFGWPPRETFLFCSTDACCDSCDHLFVTVCRWLSALGSEEEHVKERGTAASRVGFFVFKLAVFHCLVADLVLVCL